MRFCGPGTGKSNHRAGVFGWNFGGSEVVTSWGFAAAEARFAGNYPSPAHNGEEWMPHWEALFFLIFGTVFLHQAILDPRATLRGSTHPLKKWQARLLYGIFSAIYIFMGFAILLKG